MPPQFQGTSPARKRLRLSSPTYYDDQLEDLDQEAIEALDQIEFQLSQNSKSSPPLLQSNLSAFSRKQAVETNDENAHSIGLKRGFDLLIRPEDSEKAQRQMLEKGDDISIRLINSKDSHYLVENAELSFANPDQSKQLDPVPSTNSFPGFQRAPRVSSSQDQNTFGSDFGSQSNNEWIQPSKSALEEAAKKMRIWKDADEEYIASQMIAPASLTPRQTIASPSRIALSSIDNSIDVSNLASPSPASRTRKSLPFKSPLLSNYHSRVGKFKTGNVVGSPLNPNRPLQTSIATAVKPFLSLTVSSLSPGRNNVCSGESSTSIPINDITLNSTTSIPTSFSTPTRRAAPDARPKFKTPFKQSLQESAKYVVPVRTTDISNITKALPQPFKFNITQNVKKTLLTSGLYPQKYTSHELENFGINLMELNQINVETAIFYSFNTTLQQLISSTFIPSTEATFGPIAALEHLLQIGCKFVTKEWVENHWRLILWKLAGMVCLDPKREQTESKRWCWTEVVRQLKYRYEQEFDRGHRSPFKLIATRDAPASYSMILCVSDIIWFNGMPADSHPQVEVTDGWYRLQVQLDEPLKRAVKRGVIRVGRKLAVSGARLYSQRKDPDEILHVYGSCKLVLSGNSCHLAPWHAKLGFQRQPFFATLQSLTSDGGLVPMMEFVIKKVYPIGFLETKSDEKGNKIQEGPRSEAEENRIRDQWHDRRTTEASKLREVLDAKWSKWDAWADRLESIAGSFRQNEDDLPPDHIEDLFDELDSTSDVSSFIKHLNLKEAGWLAEYIRVKCEKDKSMAMEEMEGDLQSICPPRVVRNFRVLLVEDAQTNKKSTFIRAQLTVWSVLDMSVTEGGKPGSFKEGQRFIVTNLQPAQQSAWMKRASSSEVYLCTRHDSRWRIVT